jgi:hypothetical protein
MTLSSEEGLRLVYPRHYARTVVREAGRVEFINPNLGG